MKRLLPTWLAVLPLLFPVEAPAQTPDSTPDPLHTTLHSVFDRLRQGDQLEHRYTYTIYRRTQTTDDKGLSGHLSEEYELTWIGDLPYLRLRALQGAPLTGHDLQKEQELYDKFVAQHQKLDVPERIKLQGGHGVKCPTHPELALTSQYTLRDAGLDKTPVGMRHAIIAEPTTGFTLVPGECSWRYIFWFDDATLTLYRLHSDVPSDTPALCKGAHTDEWFQTIDGYPRLFHSEAHFLYLHGKHPYLMDYQDSAADFRRFRATVKFGEATEVPPEDPTSK